MSDPSERRPTRPPRRRLIAGVYNYCDRWCERCVRQQNCRLFRDQRRFEAAAAAGEEALKRLHERDDDEDDEYEGEPPLSPAEQAERLATIEEACKTTLTPEEERRMEEEYERRRRLKDAHPLACAGGAYMHVVHKLQKRLAATSSAFRDPVARAAFDAIDHHACLIGGRTRRATSELVGDEDARAFAQSLGVQSDGHGCAKVVRLAIAESRDAWTYLQTIGVLKSAGVPAAMLVRLEALDRQVQKYFPRAMEFVRPGFDDR